MTAISRNYDPLDTLYQSTVNKGNDTSELIEASEEKILKEFSQIRKVLAKLKGHHKENGALEPRFLQELTQDPFFNKIINQDAAEDQKPTKKEVVNFFYLIYKYMKTDKEQNSQFESSQMYNMLVQSNLLDELTGEAKVNLDNLTQEVSDIEKKMKDPLHEFLSIGLPLILTVVSVAAAGLGGAATSVAAKAIYFAVAAAAPALSASVVANAAQEPSQELQGDTAEAQGSSAVTSSATQATQTRIQQDQQYVQSATSNQQADLSMMQQEISQMVQAFGLGRF